MARKPARARGARGTSRGGARSRELLARGHARRRSRFLRGRRTSETLLYLTEPGELAAYEELRAGFTAAVSHELRTPLARLLALLETALLPGFDPAELVEQAQAEVEQIRELIDDVLFLSELETGREVVALGSTPALPILREVDRRALDERARGPGSRSRSRATTASSCRCGRG